MSRVLVGDAASLLTKALHEFSFSSVVFVVDPGVAATGYVQKLVAAVNAEVSDKASNTVVVPLGEPTIASVNTAADQIREYTLPLVIGVGGGSAIDTAKQISTVSMASLGVEHYLLGGNPFAGKRPVIAIPTTSGTGAEATRTCVLSDNDGRKVWSWGDELIPDLVFLDPTAAATMPRSVTIASGLDAFVHAIESATSQRKTEASEQDSLRAAQLVHGSLPEAAAHGSNLETRKQMQQAAYLAGRATDSAGTGVAHAIGHALGTLYQVPHGVAVAIAFHACLPWNVANAPHSFQSVAQQFDVQVPEIPVMFAQLLRDIEFGTVAKFQPGHHIDPLAVAATMVADENVDMFRNNCCVPSDEDRFYLAQQTAHSWDHLRA